MCGHAFTRRRTMGSLAQCFEPAWMGFDLPLDHVTIVGVVCALEEYSLPVWSFQLTLVEVKTCVSIQVPRRTGGAERAHRTASSSSASSSEKTAALDLVATGNAPSTVAAVHRAAFAEESRAFALLLE